MKITKEFSEWLINNKDYEAQLTLGELTINLGNSYLGSVKNLPLPFKELLLKQYFDKCLSDANLVLTINSKYLFDWAYQSIEMKNHSDLIYVEWFKTMIHSNNKERIIKDYFL